MELTRPRRLRAGDRVAAVTLSWGGPAVFPSRYEAGKRQLQDAFGVQVVEMPHTLAEPARLAADPQARASDLHRAFADPDIAGIVSTIGGDDAIRLLPLLDLDLIRDHPKVFLGYSDSTIIHMALRRAGLVSFYGPAVMAGFGESAGLHDYLVRGVRQAVFDPSPTPAVWPQNDQGWTVEMLDWADATSQSRPRALQPSTGWRWHGGEAREGPTIVGCLDVLVWLRGSAWWPDLDGAVLLLETSEEAPAPDLLARFLRALALTGELERLAGIVLGRPGGDQLEVARHEDYDAAILQVVRHEQDLHDLPVVTGVDFGHTDPMWTVPQGVPVRVDPQARQLILLEPAVTTSPPMTPQQLSWG